MTRDWHKAPLGDVTQFINGLWKGEDPPFIHVGVIRNTNFTREGALDDTDIAYLDVEAKKFQKRKLLPGDLILEKSGGGPKQPVGRVVLFAKTEGDFSFSNFTAAIRIKDPLALDARFLHMYLHWIYVSGRTEAMQSHSTGIRNLNGDAYKGIEIAYPSLAEQRRIVAILDEAFEGIATASANVQKNLRNARELHHGMISKAVAERGDGWAEKPIIELCRVFADGDWIESKDQSPAGIRLIQTGNIGENVFRDREEKARYISEATFKRLRCTEIFEGDCLISRLPDPVGRCCIVPSTGVRMITAVDCTIVRFDNEQVLPEFFGYYTQSRVYLNMVAKACTGTTRSRISRSSLARMPVQLPPLEEQRRLIADLDNLCEQTKSLIGVYERKLEALQQLRKSLLRDAFAGQLLHRSQ